LQSPALLFARGGASGHADDHTLESFRLAQRLGATGIHADVIATADGVPVLRASPAVGGVRRRKIAQMTAADLPDEVVTLERYYGEGLGVLDLWLAVRTSGVVPEVLAIAGRHDAVDRLWLSADDRDALRAWREESRTVRLVDATPASVIGRGVERHAAELREQRIDAVAFPRADWTGGRIAFYHRFGRRCFATDAPHDRMIAALLHIGLDGVSSPYPDRLVDAAEAHARPDAPLLRDD
jgi:hypothetical protein